jgi:hypothetical protein
MLLLIGKFRLWSGPLPNPPSHPPTHPTHTYQLPPLIDDYYNLCILEGTRGKVVHGIPLLLGAGLDVIGWRNFMRVWSDIPSSGYGYKDIKLVLMSVGCEG